MKQATPLMLTASLRRKVLSQIWLTLTEVPGRERSGLPWNRAGKIAKSAELETQAYKWEQLIAKNHYLDHEVRDHYRSRIASARREAAILRGEPFPDPVPDQPVSKTVSLTLPR